MLDFNSSIRVYSNPMLKENAKYPENWFATWFDEWYMKVYQHRDEREAADFISKWNIWEKLNPEDWCLDLGCGAGRFAQLFAKKGYNTLAVDLSMPLLEAARKDLSGNANPYYVRSDMRCLPTVKRFGLIMSLFTSFGYFESDEEHSTLLRDLSNRLRPKGIIVLDLPNSSDVERKVSELPITEKNIENVVVREERYMEMQPKRVIKRIIISKDKETFKYTESVRLYTNLEIEAMFQSVGISSVEHPWGDYSGSPYSNSSSRMIYFGKRIG
ncbi:MAG: methyltransferase domain-containing protein [Calditrichaeota bacterium]|nr:methyltransferase domain-containing protein [Calditrichota bacterium]